jgi:hypothetical protein
MTNKHLAVGVGIVSLHFGAAALSLETWAFAFPAAMGAWLSFCIWRTPE